MVPCNVMEAVKKLRRNSEDRSESENDSEGHSGSEGEERLSAFDLDSGDESDSDVDPNLVNMAIAGTSDGARLIPSCTQ